jgi:hypothetical protein
LIVASNSLFQKINYQLSFVSLSLLNNPMFQPKYILEVKNIPKRTVQLSLIALIFSLGIVIYFYTFGLLMSSLMVGCFTLVIAILLTFQLFGKLKDSHLLVILSVCVLLVISSKIEGSKTGQYFFFFPLIQVIPIVVDSKSATRKKFLLTYCLVLASFASCFYIGHNVNSLEQISSHVADTILYSNLSCAVLISLLFSIANIFYEKKLIAELNTIKHIQSHEMRKPIASMMGLMDIWKHENYEFDEDIIRRLEQTVYEVDEKIHLIVNERNIN